MSRILVYAVRSKQISAGRLKSDVRLVGNWERGADAEGEGMIIG